MRSFIFSRSPGSKLLRAFGRDPAARRAELGDGVEQPVLRLRWQVAEQSFRAPRGRLARVESGGPQRGWPIVAQVDGDHAPVGGGLGAQLGEGAGLEFDDLRLVDLVDHRLGGPGQPVGAGIQPRGQDHHLLDAGLRRVQEELVEELGAHGHVVGHPGHGPGGSRAAVGDVAGVEDVVQLGRVQLAAGQPGEQVHADGAHQWLGERVVDQWTLFAGGHGAGRGDHGGGHSDAGRQVPGVAFKPSGGSHFFAPYRMYLDYLSIILSQYNKLPPLYAGAGMRQP